jgi:valyl-tRNA synthetase
MMMFGLKIMDEVPFRQVYIHGLVRDAEGQKMSKSKGNTIDPDEVQRRYGTDAVRLTMAMLAAPGNDIPLAPERMEGYRAFANKLWNACRFVEMKVGDRAETVPYTEDQLTLVDRWILGRTHAVIGEVNEALEQHRFDRAADVLYHFAWHEFCDWYIEIVKPDLAPFGEPGAGPGEGREAVARAVLLEVLDTILRLLHPIMPFLTEELWQKFPHTGDYLATSHWPNARPERADVRAERDMAMLQELVVKIRNVRAEAGIDPSRRIEVLVHAENPEDGRLVADQSALVAALVRAESVAVVDAFPADLVSARGVVRGFEVAVPLAGLLDFDAERTRLLKELRKIDAELDARNRKLSNESFLERAPADVVEKEKAIQREFFEKKRRIESTLSTLPDQGPAA